MLSRPWKTPEGTVNRPVLKMMMTGVLMHVMTVPGVTLEDLSEKYNPILQPVTLMDILEVAIAVILVVRFPTTHKVSDDVMYDRSVLHECVCTLVSSFCCYLQMLDICGCVKRSFIRKSSPKPTLFSSRRHVSESE